MTAQGKQATLKIPPYITVIILESAYLVRIAKIGIQSYSIKRNDES